jgi:copper(I)-binding protein
MRSSSRSWPRLALAAVAIAAFALTTILAACGQAGATPGPMSVRDAWIREPIGGKTAGYLVIENATGQADALKMVTLPAGGTAMLHRTTTDASGMSGMSPVDAINIPSGGTVTLEPGGFHIMIDGLTAKAGDKVELKLQFEHAGAVSVQAEVRAG